MRFKSTLAILVILLLVLSNYVTADELSVNNEKVDNIQYGNSDNDTSKIEVKEVLKLTHFNASKSIAKEPKRHIQSIANVEENDNNELSNDTITKEPDKAISNERITNETSTATKIKEGAEKVADIALTIAIWLSPVAAAAIFAPIPGAKAVAVAVLLLMLALFVVAVAALGVAKVASWYC